MFRFLLPVSLLILFFSCGKKEREVVEEKPLRVVQVPTFSGDSAYGFTKKQVSFGPRIPNTPAHQATGNYLIAQFKSFGATVTVQEFNASTWDGRKLFLRNIIASYSPDKQKRIMLAAHWDTRPFADKDVNNKRATFDGANDGASGVAVLMEIARLLGSNAAPDVGIDLVLFDGEDWGFDGVDWGEKKGMMTQNPPPQGQDSWWCLGSQYWAKHKHKSNYSAYYGILLDMVGARDSHFFQEGNSMEYAPRIVEKVWGTASRLGYSSVFVRQKEGAILDDHLYINEIGKIPTIDIVHFDPEVGYFGDYHHTQKDNLSLISKETLQIVGNVLLNVIYYEEP